MSCGRDKTYNKKIRNLQSKYIATVNERVATGIRAEADSERKKERQAKYNKYLDLIEKWIEDGQSVEKIYIKLKPFMQKDLGIDPKAVIEWKTGKKINLGGPSVNKDETYDNR